MYTASCINLNTYSTKDKYVFVTLNLFQGLIEAKRDAEIVDSELNSGPGSE